MALTAEWFRQERGIDNTTLDEFGVRAQQDTLVFPYPDGGEKFRKHDPDGKRKFWFTNGMTPGLYSHPTEIKEPQGTVFLVEGETDTMRLWQELRAEGSHTPVYGISGINTWRSDLAERFKYADHVLVILDNDPDYNVGARVDAVWKDIRHDLGHKARRLRLPTKDVCEFFQEHGLASLRTLAERRPVSVSRYRPLDFDKEPPPPNWLVDDFIALGDATILVGDGGLGKSWLTMDLTRCIAEGADAFLGMKLNQHGRVLYVDEENPEDVIYARLKRLGLTPAGARNIRYLNNQGIRLDREPDAFLEEALDYNPTLIVLDSLTRIHTQDENAAGAMSALYNDGIKPLARDTGAAVILIHHTNKGQGSAYTRARGSTDIVYAMDAGIDVRPTEPYTEGMFTTKLFRSRRRKGGDAFVVAVRDQEDGSVTLDHEAVPEPPF